jgi:hypothetical protein
MLAMALLSGGAARVPTVLFVAGVAGVAVVGGVRVPIRGLATMARPGLLHVALLRNWVGQSGAARLDGLGGLFGPTDMGT